MSTTSQQQTPPAPALTDTELTHLATALTGYTTSAHPAYRAAAARTALDTLTSTPLESITAAIQLTDNDCAALAALAAARLDTCPVCADLVPENSPGPFCSIFCQQRHGGTSA